MAVTPNTAAPLTESAQSQKEVTLNAAILLLDDILNPGILTGTLAARPAADWPGRLYFATDNPPTVYRDDGANWIALLEGSGATGLGAHTHKGTGQGGALTDPWFVGQAGTPGVNPPPGQFALYFKGDGLLYKLDSAGLETQVGAGGGGAGGHVIQEEGASLPARSKLNFVGPATATDDPANDRTNVTVATPAPAAPVDAEYIVGAANGALTAERLLSSVIGEGTLAARPAPGTLPAGSIYVATDLDGGTAYRNTGSGWTQIAKGVMAPHGHQIQEEGTNLPMRPAMNFTGGGVTAADDPTNNRVNVDVPTPAPLAADYIVGTAQAGMPNEKVLGTDIHREGLILARPAANTVLPGTYYTATNDQGGTTYRSDGATWIPIAAPVNATATGSGHTIQEEGVSLAQRTGLNFTGAGVTATDNPGNNRTDVTIPQGAPLAAPYVTTAADATLTAEKVLATDVIMVGTLAARPAPGVAVNGALYLATDDNSGTMYRNNGTAWVKAAPGVGEVSGGVWTRTAGGLLYPSTIADRFALGDLTDTPHQLRVVMSGATDAAGVPRAPIYVDQTITSVANPAPDIGAINAFIKYRAIAPGGVADLAHTGLDIRGEYGSSAVVAQGTQHMATFVMDVLNSSSVNNEVTPFFSYARARHHTTLGANGPPCSLWGADINVHGPIGTQAGAIMGPVVCINKYHNSIPTRCEDAALILVTRQGAGAGAELGHSTATTFPMENGLVIAGTSTGGVGFNKGIRLGNPIGSVAASASPWFPTGNSSIGIGITMNNLASKAMLLDGGNTRIQWGQDVAASTAFLDLAASHFLQLEGRLRITNNQATNAPFLDIGSAAAGQDNQILLRNGSGALSWNVVGVAGNFIPGSLVGDGVLLSGSGRLRIGKDGATPAYGTMDTGTWDLQKLKVNGGETIQGYRRAVVAYNPPSIPPGGWETVNVTVTGAAMGDHATAAFDIALPDGVMMTQPQVMAAGQVKVTLMNWTTAAVDLAAGNLSVSVIKH